jgi:hypothetical protein
MKFGNTFINNGVVGWIVVISNLIRASINSYIISIEVVDIYFFTPLKLQCGTAKTLPTHKIAEKAEGRKPERLAKTGACYIIFVYFLFHFAFWPYFLSSLSFFLFI